MNFNMNKGIFSSMILNSHIQSANVQTKERLLGFFFGPAGIILLNAIIASYLNVFYTDVLKISYLWGGLFLTIFPVISKINDAITNVIMGIIIDHTHSRQGKARPWLLISAPIIAISAVLLVMVPNASTTVKAIWILISYNLYYSIGYTIYYMSHSMMVPLSTRNTKQRDGLAVISNLAMAILPGMFVALLFPMLVLPVLGVDQSNWINMMVIFSIVALPAIFMEYFFTKERITEESYGLEEKKEVPTTRNQLKACLSSKYWIIIMAVTIITQLCGNFQNTSLIYYCNWVLGTYNDGITPTLVSAVGNAPLGLGVLIMWPLCKKFGKRNITLVGLVLMLIGGSLFLLNPTNMGYVLISLIIRAFGSLPITYVTMAMLAEAMDHVEWKSGFRCDGLSIAVYSVIFTLSAGVAMGAFNFGLAQFGYIPPASDGTWVAQNSTIQNYFTFGYMGMYTIATIVLFILFWFYKVEKDIPTIQADIIARHKAEAAAMGRTWISPEEKAEIEQKELDRIAEEKRIEELKAKCSKKGLNYDEEEAKYQAKLMRKQKK